ncbi:oligosaccharide flippase family protein [bacterium]|nr:oligosaccharide flippase family protein [bacterium]
MPESDKEAVSIAVLGYKNKGILRNCYNEDDPIDLYGRYANNRVCNWLCCSYDWASTTLKDTVLVKDMKWKIADKSTLDLIKSFSGSSLIKIFSVISGMVISVLFARLLGPEEYGIYTLILSLIILLGLPSQSGVPTLVTRETAKYKHLNDWGHIKGLLIKINIWTFSYSILTSCIAIMIFPFFLRRNWSYLLYNCSISTSYRGI